VHCPEFAAGNGHPLRVGGILRRRVDREMLGVNCGTQNLLFEIKEDMAEWSSDFRQTRTDCCNSRKTDATRWGEFAKQLTATVTPQPANQIERWLDVAIAYLKGKDAGFAGRRLLG